MTYLPYNAAAGRNLLADAEALHADVIDWLEDIEDCIEAGDRVDRPAGMFDLYLSTAKALAAVRAVVAAEAA